MEGVIAREREINWSEVHFHFAFKTRRHATQFGLSVGFLCMCLYLSIWVWTKAGVYDCACVCQRVPMPHGPAVDLYRSPFIPQIYRPVLTQSSFFLLLIKTLYVQYFPSHFRRSQDHVTSHDCVCVCMVCEQARRRKISQGDNVCVCERESARLCALLLVLQLVCLSIKSVCFPSLLFGYCVNWTVCAKVSVCLPHNYDISASHASLDVSTHQQCLYYYYIISLIRSLCLF